MIEITRSLARQLKTIFRRTISESGRGVVSEPVLFHAGPEGLRVRIAARDVAAEYRDSEPRESDAVIVPFSFLGDCEGGRSEPVQLEASGGNEVLATWDDKGVPQMLRYQMPEVKHHFPELPTSFAENSSELCSALHDSMQTASAESTRYALNNVQLQGAGAIVATDGRQLLCESGFEFPWDEDLLVPRRTVLGSKELPQDHSVFVGRTENFVCFRIGPWSFLFAIDVDARFPTVVDLIRDPADAVAAIQISDADATFLLKSLKQLPGNDDLYSPITVDANGSVAVRSKSDDSPQPIEVLLANSSRTGKAERFNSNRIYLRRALSMGFREIHVFGRDKPVLCQDDRRSFIWMLLTPDGVIKPSKNAIRIDSSDARVSGQPSSQTKEESQTKMTKPQSDQDTNGKTNRESGVDDLIDHAEQLKVSLRESLTKTSDLVAGLKRHRKQSKLVRSTLQSLKQLQTLDA